MKLCKGDETLSLLSKHIQGSQTFRGAIAFWGAGAVKQLGLTGAHNIEVVCNVDMGGTNPVVIKELLELNAAVRIHPRLHAKLGLTDGFGFVGSSNASANGLGFQGGSAQGWEELNVVFEEVGDLARLQEEFARLWEMSSPLEGPGDKRLAEAAEKWALRQSVLGQTGISPGGPDNLVDSLLSDPDRFRGGNIHVIMYPPLLPEEEERYEQQKAKALQDVDLSVVRTLDVYWDWDPLPEVAYLLDVAVPGPRRKRFRYQGVYERMPRYDKDDIQTCVELDTVPGFARLTLREQKILEQAVRRYWQSLPPEGRVSHWKPVSEMREYIVAAHAENS